MIAFVRLATAGAAASMLAACSVASQPSTPGASSAQSLARGRIESPSALERFGIDRAAYARSFALRGQGVSPAKKTATLFVSDLDGNEIRLFPANKKNPTQSGTIATGIDLPINVAVDAQGTLYVANNGNNTVTEYPLGATSPSVTLSTSLVYPNGVAVDSAGTVYVTSGSTVGQCYVLEFPKGSTSPTTQVNGLGLPIGLAIDKDDNLYIGDANTNEVYEVPKGTTTPMNLGLSDLSDPTGVAVSPTDDLYVSNENHGSYAVNAFHLGTTSPFETITSGLDGPYAIGFDNKGKLFVGNGAQQPGSVTAYKKNQTTPYETISGVGNPVGIGVYPPSKD